MFSPAGEGAFDDRAKAESMTGSPHPEGRGHRRDSLGDFSDCVEFGQSPSSQVSDCLHMVKPLYSHHR